MKNILSKEYMEKMFGTGVACLVIGVVALGIAIAALVLIFYPPKNKLYDQAASDINSLYDANSNCIEAEYKLKAKELEFLKKNNKKCDFSFND